MPEQSQTDTQDYDESLPPSRTDGADRVTWPVLIQPYVKNTQLFLCPSVSDRTSAIAYTPNAAYSIPSISRSYLCNGGSTGAAADVPGPVENRPMNQEGYGEGGAMLAQLENSATTILIGEHDGATNEQKFYNTADISTGSGNSRLTDHLGMSNWLFADGHVKALKPTATDTPINMWVMSQQDTVVPGANWVTALKNAQNAMS